MAKIVFGAGVPHTPYFPRIVQQGGRSGARIQGLFGEVKHRLEAAQPDVLLILDSDHFVNFFYNNLPTFCVGLADDAEGPYETSRQMPWYKVTIDREFGQGLLTHGLNSSFDLAGAEELRLDHSILVPLHFLTPGMNIPVVPVFIKGLTTPLPRSRRCYELGKMIRRFVESWTGNQRVAVIASGSFSLEVGGPQMGWIDEDWIKNVVQMMTAGNTADLVRRATSRRMLAAGNTGGELLNWIALLGALDDKRPTFIEPDLQPPEDPRDGHAYAVWELDKS
jgi:hypothetical protein